ncbi:MAG: hypothetical protein M0P71_12390 [Melioribacteraceae bacterium]|jgi:hypothetical protein|nr:hypothetical protein [Melioribacteraceae bacterium]
MEITVWESCLVKRIRNIQEEMKTPVHPDNEIILTVTDLFKLVDNDVLELSKITIEEVIQEESNEEQIQQSIVYDIDWNLFKENKYEVFLLPKTNRSEGIKLRTKVSLLALRKGYIINIIDKIAGKSLIIEIENVEEGFDNKTCTEYLHIKGIQLNNLSNGE